MKFPICARRVWLRGLLGSARLLTGLLLLGLLLPGLGACVPVPDSEVAAATPVDWNAGQITWRDYFDGLKQAARDVGALFYPINPGAEEASWERFVNEGIERFFSKRYAGEYEKSLIDEFMKLLPHNPPWQIA